MTKKELVKEVAFQTAYNQGQVAAIISQIENSIEAALMRGESVELTGFGKFEPVDQPARTYRDPHNGGMVSVRAKRRVKFRPGAGLKRAVTG